MEVHVDKFVKEYVSQMAGKSVDIERFVPDASGLSPAMTEIKYIDFAQTADILRYQEVR